ncbi:MAG: isoprenylcysteine carboxylmethyltransferase family protein [Candidatus Cybelea sp.]
MKPITLLFKTAFPAACAIVLFGLITWQLRRLDPYIPIAFPAWMVLAGIVLGVAGAMLAFVCFALFAIGGSLTPGPSFPDPNVFVDVGPYRYVRNPMAVGLLAALVGWSFFQRSVSDLLLALLVIALMHALIVFVEEPKLERRFGQSYLTYKRRVGRWIPGLRIR